jgi:hypothetical protein
LTRFKGWLGVCFTVDLTATSAKLGSAGMKGERPNTEPTPDKNKPASVGRELLKGCLHLFWTWIGFDALAEDFATHENAVRKANVLRFLLVVSLLVGIFGYILRGCIDSSDIQTLKNDSMSNSAALDFYKRQGTEADKKLQQQAQDIQILHTENASLANQAAISASIPLHMVSIVSNLDNILATDPTNRQQLLQLQYTVEAFTNAFAESTLRPTFDLYINDTRSPDQMTFVLKQPRVMRILIKSLTTLTANEVTANFVIMDSTDPTNFDLTGWTRGAATITESFGHSYRGQTIHTTNTVTNIWTWKADKLVTGSANSYSYYTLPSISISTNLPSIYNDPMRMPIYTKFLVYAVGAKTTPHAVFIELR